MFSCVLDYRCAFSHAIAARPVSPSIAFASEVNKLHFDTNAAVVEQDASMQRLVFTNYHKFIAATTTVRSLNADVAATDADMRGLFQNIDEIGARATGIEQRLAPHKTKVEQLVGVRRLLKRVEFLFELPARLAKSVELGAYAQAVRYHRVAARLLSQVRTRLGYRSQREMQLNHWHSIHGQSFGRKSFVFIHKKSSGRVSALCIFMFCKKNVCETFSTPFSIFDACD